MHCTSMFYVLILVVDNAACLKISCCFEIRGFAIQSTSLDLRRGKMDGGGAAAFNDDGAGLK